MLLFQGVTSRDGLETLALDGKSEPNKKHYVSIDA
jgi:hypothetical protein